MIPAPKFFEPDALTRARALFPHTQQGKIYLNHASTSPLSTRVVAAMTAYLAERSQGRLDNFPADIRMAGELRSLIRRLINAESDDRIAFQFNTSDAINVVASGIPWSAGDRIVLNNIEFPANVYPFINLRRLGVEIDTVQSADGRVTPEAIEATITPRTRLVALSAVQFLSGYRADMATIGTLCREKNIVFAVDGIQAVGAVCIDVQAMKIDALSAGAQKWQMGPHGSGFLYLTEQLQSTIRQTNLGWLAVKDPWSFYDYEQPLAASARRYEGGSLNMPSLWGLHAAIGTLLEFGLDGIERHILALTSRLMENLSILPGVTVVTPRRDSERAGIVTVQLPAHITQHGLFKMISGRNVMISLREGKLRYAPHFYNSVEEIDSAVDITAECLRSITQ